MLKENALIISAATACGAVLFGFMERQNQGAAPNWTRVARNSAFGGVAGFTAVAGYLQAKKATQGAGAEIWVGCGISAGVLAASIYSQYQQHTYTHQRNTEQITRTQPKPTTTTQNIKQYQWQYQGHYKLNACNKSKQSTPPVGF